MKKTMIAALLGFSACTAQAQTEIKFVMEATYAPFEYMDENNQVQGFDVDLANALCQELKATCRFHNQSFDSLIPAIKFKRFDAAISAIDITAARSKQVAFTNPYYDNAAVFVTLANNQITSLAGKRVGVQNGSTHQSYLLEQMKGTTIVPYSSYQDAFLDMKAGRIDGVFGDTAVIAEWLKSDKTVKTVGAPITDPNYFGNGFGIAVHKSNSTLVDQLNTALDRIKANGQYDTIYNHYFGQ